tara:strand:- start:3152 stop:4138 length:987 start_codon:yes stop_codon:yes gene_type:complete
LIKSISLIEGVGLTTRPIFLSDSKVPNLDPNIFRFEANKKARYDVLVQHMLPPHMIYSGDFGSVVGITSIETKGNNQWDNYLHLLDKLLVSTKAEKQCVAKDLRKKIYSIGGAQEPDSREKNLAPGRFTFYSVGGELESRGGVRESLQAYFAEFHLNEAVSFVLQANDPEKAQLLINEVTQEVGLYGLPYYPHIHLVQSDEDLHNNCHCFIDMASSIGFNPETAKALLKGNVPIVLKNSGRDEYVNNKNGSVVESIEDVLICPDRPLRDMFTARESCIMPNITSLKKAMRESFDSKIGFLKKSRRGAESEGPLSHLRQSKTIEEILCS